GRRRPPCRARRNPPWLHPEGRRRHRAGAALALPEEGLGQGNVELRAARSSDLHPDAEVPHLSDQRVLPLSEEDQSLEHHAPIAAAASSSASEAMTATVSERASPE